MLSTNASASTVDIVGGIELNLPSSALPIATQAVNVANALITPGMHGRFLAEYAAWLLRAASDSETAQLAEALETSATSAFTESGELTLLSQLCRGIRAGFAPSANLAKVLARATCGS